MPPTNVDFIRDRLEGEVGGVDLAMGMGIRDADDLTLVFKDEDVLHFGPVAKLAILLLPTFEESAYLIDGLFGERGVVERAVADDAGDAVRRAIAEEAAGRSHEFAGRIGRDTGQIVVEDKDARVFFVAGAMHAGVSGAEIAILHVGRLGGDRVAADICSGPGPSVAVGGDDHPFLTQRMPALLPSFARQTERPIAGLRTESARNSESCAT